MADSKIVDYYLQNYFAIDDSVVNGASERYAAYLNDYANTANPEDAAKIKSDFYNEYFGAVNSNQVLDSDGFDAESGTSREVSYEVDGDGLYRNIIGTKGDKFQYNQYNLSTIESKLGDINYGENGSYHLEDKMNEKGEVTSYGIDHYIESASDTEKELLEKKKSELLSERDKWNELYSNAWNDYNKADLELAIRNKNSELMTDFQFSDSFSDEDRTKAAQDLAAMEITYFDKYESKSLSGEALENRSAQISALKEAYPEWKTRTYAFSEPTYDESNNVIHTMSGVTDVKLKAWEKTSDVKSLSKDEQKEYMEYFESEYAGNSAEETADFVQDKQMYLRCKQENGIDLTDDEKIWSIDQFESKSPSINGAADYQAYQSEQVLMNQYKRELVDSFDGISPSINSQYDADAYQKRKALIDGYRNDLTPAEKTDADIPNDSSQEAAAVEQPADDEVIKEAEPVSVPLASKPEKKSPYDFDDPARPDGMSDDDYTKMCDTERQAHIDKVNDEIADAVIRGEYGVGQERIEMLMAGGYDYAQVQASVNQKMAAYEAASKADEVVAEKPTVQTQSKSVNDEMSGEGITIPEENVTYMEGIFVPDAIQIGDESNMKASSLTDLVDMSDSKTQRAVKAVQNGYANDKCLVLDGHGRLLFADSVQSGENGLVIQNADSFVDETGKASKKSLDLDDIVHADDKQSKALLDSIKNGDSSGKWVVIDQNGKMSVSDNVQFESDAEHSNEGSTYGEGIRVAGEGDIYPAYGEGISVPDAVQTGSADQKSKPKKAVRSLDAEDDVTETVTRTKKSEQKAKAADEKTYDPDSRGYLAGQPAADGYIGEKGADAVYHDQPAANPYIDEKGADSKYHDQPAADLFINESGSSKTHITRSRFDKAIAGGSSIGSQHEAADQYDD